MALYGSLQPSKALYSPLRPSKALYSPLQPSKAPYGPLQPVYYCSPLSLYSPSALLPPALYHLYGPLSTLWPPVTSMALCLSTALCLLYGPLSLRPSVSTALCPLYSPLPHLRPSTPSMAICPLYRPVSPVAICPLCGTLFREMMFLRCLAKQRNKPKSDPLFFRKIRVS
jgi:hypothetical protein